MPPTPLPTLDRLLILLALGPAPLTATGRLRASAQRALGGRLAAWERRLGGSGGRPKGVAPPNGDDTGQTVATVANLVDLATTLRLVAPAAGQLCPLPGAAAWLALPYAERIRRCAAVDVCMALDSEGLGEDDRQGGRRPSDNLDDGAEPPAAQALLLAPDLVLLDGAHTPAAAVFALAPWAEWEEQRACLRLTEASVRRAAAPLLACGQDAAGVLLSLLARVATPQPTSLQQRRLHAWCVQRTATEGGREGEPAMQRSRTPAVGLGSAAWQLAALRFLEALAQQVPGIPSPPAACLNAVAGEVLRGAAAAGDAEGGQTVTADVANWVQAWLAALRRAAGLGGLPIGVNPQHLEAVEAARVLEEAVLLRYRAGSGEITWREVTPLRIEWRRGQLLLVAHCHLRREERSFRLDRLQEVRPAAAMGEGWAGGQG